MVGSARVRRWVASLVGVALTAAGTALIVVAPPLGYQATAQTLFVLPKTARSTQIDLNAFLYSPDGLIGLARASVVSTRSEAFQRDLVAAGATSQYQLDAEITTPIVRFSVQGPDAGNVDATMAELLQRFSDVVARTQIEAGAPERQIARAMVVQSIEATAVMGDRIRAAVVTAVVGLALTAITASAIGRKPPPRQGGHPGGRRSARKELVGAGNR